MKDKNRTTGDPKPVPYSANPQRLKARLALRAEIVKTIPAGHRKSEFRKRWALVVGNYSR